MIEQEVIEQIDTGSRFEGVQIGHGSEVQSLAPVKYIFRHVKANGEVLIIFEKPMVNIPLPTKIDFKTGQQSQLPFKLVVVPGDYSDEDNLQISSIDELKFFD